MADCSMPLDFYRAELERIVDVYGEVLDQIWNYKLVDRTMVLPSHQEFRYVLKRLNFEIPLELEEEIRRNPLLVGEWKVWWFWDGKGFDRISYYRGAVGWEWGGDLRHYGVGPEVVPPPPKTWKDYAYCHKIPVFDV